MTHMYLKRLKFQLIILFAIVAGTVQSQEVELPDSLFIKLVKMEYVLNDTLNQEFYVEYPEDYKEDYEYPIFIGISGGNQSQDMVMYCYAIYFNTPLLKDYIKVFPIAVDQNGMMLSNSKYFEGVLQLIQNNNSCTADGWLIAGTSNGGIAALEMVTVNPSLFSGLITMPGIIYGDNINVTNDWAHIKALLAYGENDSEGWIHGVIKTDSVFKAHSMKTDTLKIQRQGHILEMGYDINVVYDEFFNLK